MDGGLLQIATARDGAPALALAPPEQLYPAGVSLIVCTYNRLELLKKMVESVAAQLPVAFPFELLIVDNNSTDGTAEYVRDLQARMPALSYYRETKQGLSHARNGGAAAARYEFLLYCDDDARLPGHYLETLGAALAEHDPDMFGGPCLPDYVNAKPSWFPESLEVRRKANASGFYHHVTLSGSNFGMKRSVLAKIGGFNPEFGMSANRPGMLEERLAVETYRRLTPASRQKVYYHVDAFVFHHTPAQRMRVGFQIRRIYQANYRYMRYCLEQGVRSPALMAGLAAKRLVSETWRLARETPLIWRSRLSQPDRPMMELIRLVYRVADAHAALEFLLTDWGRSRKRLRSSMEQRPLQAVLLHSAKLPPRSATPIFNGQCVLHHLSVAGMNSKRIRAALDDLNLRSVDLVISDSTKVVGICALLRAHMPQLQIVLWANGASFAIAQRPWMTWRTPLRLISTLRRLRKASRQADQVVWSVSPNGRIARLLLGARSWSSPAQSPRHEAPLAVRRQWAQVLADAALWAPRRLSA